MEYGKRTFVKKGRLRRKLDMDRRMAQSLDKYLTAPPEEKEVESLSEKEFISRVFKYLDIHLDEIDHKQIGEFLTEFHKEYCEVEFIPKEND